MNFEFGVSFNCVVIYDEFVDRAEELSVTSYVSNDREKLIAHVVDGDGLVFTTDHDYVGGSTDVGGKVIGVFVEKDEPEWAVAVLFAQPMVPDVI